MDKALMTLLMLGQRFLGLFWSIYPSWVRTVKIRIGERGTVHCPGCDAIMKKLYWKQVKVFGVTPAAFIFTQWYGCTDCGEYVYDTHGDVVLSQFIEYSELASDTRENPNKEE